MELKKEIIEDIMDLYFQKQKSSTEIGKIYNISSYRVIEAIRINGGTIRNFRNVIPIELHEEICDKYKNTSLNFTTLSKLYNFGTGAIKALIVKNKIQIKNGKHHIKHLDEFVKLYKSGVSITKIGKMFNIDKKAVNNILVNNGTKVTEDRNIEAEDILEFYKSLNKDQNEVIVKGTILNNIRKYHFYEDYFRDINNSDKAYITGLLHADGNLAKPNQIRIKLSDKELIKEVSRRFYENERPLLTYKTSKEHHKTPYIFVVSNDQIQQDCIRHGCIKNKTYNLEFPTTIPDKFISDYLRGVFDGDGCVYVNEHFKYKPVTIKIVATRVWAESLKLYLKNIGISSQICDDKRVDKRVTGITIVTVPDIIKFYFFIYQNIENKIFLKRKYEKYSNYIQFKLSTTKEYDKIYKLV